MRDLLSLLPARLEHDLSDTNHDITGGGVVVISCVHGCNSINVFHIQAGFHPATKFGREEQQVGQHIILLRSTLRLGGLWDF